MSEAFDPALSNQNQPRDDSLIWTLEPMPVILEIEQLLRGKIFNELSGVYEQKVEPLMSEEGINYFVITLRKVINKNTVLANLKEEDVNRISAEVRKSTINFIFMNYDRFEISKEMFDHIVETIDHQVYCFLTRPKDAGERNRLMTTQRHLESHIQRDNANQKKGFLGGLFKSRENKEYEQVMN